MHSKKQHLTFKTIREITSDICNYEIKNIDILVLKSSTKSITGS